MEFLALDHFDPTLAFDLDETERPPASPIANAMPCGPAGHDGAGAGLGGEPSCHIHSVAPQVEHVLPLPNNSRHHRPKLDADPNLPFGFDRRDTATMSSPHCRLAKIGSGTRLNNPAVAMKASPIVLIFSISCRRTIRSYSPTSA